MPDALPTDAADSRRTNSRRAVSTRVNAAFASLAVIVASSTLLAQTDNELLERLRRLEAKRKALIAKVSPSVCSVMGLKARGGGSGVIFHPRGWILTNFHVTGKNKVMKIGLPDGKFYMSDVIGVDPGGDVAVCALRGNGPMQDGTWPHCELGDSDSLKIGGLAYAMGNPFLAGE